jgi:tetratricopeptide (TPR) repeat protein
LAEARESIEKALEAEPENVIAHAIRALVYDWSATAEIKDQISVGDLVRVQAVLNQGGEITARVIEAIDPLTVPSNAETTEGEATLIFSGEVESIHTDEWRVSGRTVQVATTTLIRKPDRREEFFAEAERSAERARQIEPGNILSLAFNAEVLVDQLNFAEAFDLAGKAADALSELGDQYEFAMDIHRVYGTVLESQALYLQAILEYEKARQINPNLTFLHLSIGANYRQLRDIDRALYYFDMAADINQQHGIKDPTPYLAIGKTYQQQGEFFIAAINIERALAIDPYNPDIYGRLGIVYFQARNYESAIDILRCATRGCSVAETRDRICRFAYRLDSGCEEAQVLDQEVVGLELGPNSVEYYYTYGSVLAAYNGHVDYPRVCIEAEEIFTKLTNQYGSDPLVSAIVDEGRAICGSSGIAPYRLPTSTPFPDESS